MNYCCRLIRLVVTIGVLGLFCWSIAESVQSPCPRAIRTNTNYQYRGELHFVCLQVEPNSRPRLDVIQWRTSQLIWSDYINEFDTNQLASFVDNEGTLRILLAVPNKINGTTMYSIDSTGRGLDEKHTVNTQFVSTLAIWRLELNWEYHLAIANQPYLEHLVGAPNQYGNRRPPSTPLPQPGPIITLHSWRHTYFDRYQKIELPYNGRVNKLEPMHINDQEFLIVAMESTSAADGGRHSTPIDSLIYKLDFSEGTLVWLQYQTLNTKLALDASSFLITHRGSVQVDYYIAIVGQLQDDTEERGVLYNENVEAKHEQHGLIIYKYYGDHFVKTNSIFVPGATKLDTITYGQGDSHVVVALLSGWPGQQISLFLFDGLNLKPMPSPNLRAAPQANLGPQPSMKYRRTMDTNSLHLFRMPSNITSGDDTNDPYKRNLESVLQGGGLPALVFSSITNDDSANDVANATATAGYSGDNSSDQDTLYQIPVLEHIDSPDQYTSYIKRNFINYQAGPSAMDLLGWCKDQISSIINDRFESAAQKLALLPRIDQPKPIEILGDLEIEGNLHVSNLLYASQLVDQTNRTSFIDPSLLGATKSTFDQISRTHLEIDSLKNRVDQILVDDGTVQEVHVPLRFQRLVFECLNPTNMNPRLHPMVGIPACPQVGELHTHHLNGRNVSDIQRQALLTGRSVVVGQEVRFEHLVLRGRTAILNTLNKLRIEEIVFGRGRKPIGFIYGHKEFQGGLYSTANLIVEDWNGALVDRETTLTSTGEQRIEANLRFSEVVLDSQIYNGANNYSIDSSRVEFLNGLHLDAHLNQIAQLDEDNKFELPIFFDELVINGPVFFGPESQLSGINLESLWTSVLFGHSNQNITAPMEFRNVFVSYGGDIQVDGLINGLILTPNNVMMRDRNYSLPNPFVFESDLSVRLLQVEKALNGIQVFINSETNQRELAILYDGGYQELTGDKILNEVRLGGTSEIHGLINGHLNLTQLNTLVRNNGEPFRFKHIHMRRSLLRVADNVHLHIGSLINGVPADHICAFANSLANNQMQQRSYERLKFDRQPIVFKQLRCASINGYNNLGNHFLLRHANQRVAGTLRLVNGATFNSTINIGGTFNNMNIEPLARSIAQILNESRTGHKDFYQDLVIDSLTARSINDLQLSSVFYATSDFPQIITAPMSFDHLDIENVIVVDSALQTPSFNQLNVTDIFKNTLQYDKPQMIYSHVEIDNLHILPGSNLITRSLNNHDLNRLYSDAVLNDVDQQIVAPKTFKGFTELANRVELVFGIDGLSEKELKFNLQLQSDELIEDDIEFENDITIRKSLEIQTGQINDVDVNLFVNSMLYETRPNGFRVLGNSSLRFRDVKLNDLVVTGTIQGVDLSRDAIQKSDNSNGSYDALIQREQMMRHNQQLFNRLYNSGSTFNVQTRVQNESLSGSCQIHSCPQTTPLITLVPTDPNRNRPPMHQVPMQSLPIAQPYTKPAPLSSVPWILTRPPTAPAPQQRPQSQPQPWHQQIPFRIEPIRPPVYHAPFTPIMPRPQGLVNTSLVPHVWRPKVRPHQSRIPVNDTHFNYHKTTELVDPKYLERQTQLTAHAINDLALRVNKFLSVSFYYEILQHHPDLGPALNAVESPIANEQGYAMLLLKAVGKKGEPCLLQNQTISVVSTHRKEGQVTKFMISSQIQETSNPSLVESVVVQGRHYLFVADLRSRKEAMSWVLIYLWNPRSGMYDMLHRIPVDGYPSAMKAFVIDGHLACLAIANPRVVQSNNSGEPLLYCQRSQEAKFDWKIVVKMNGIFDLDVVSLPSIEFGAGRSGSYIMIAGLAQHDTFQVGDLIVGLFEVHTEHLTNLITRRTARPLKLHFVKQSARIMPTMYSLVVSEGITSNDGVQATTRIFSLSPSGHIGGVQTIRDNQFADIQSVLLNDHSAMIFMRSTHSISIYAPLGFDTQDRRCLMNQYKLIQRLPTKGATKFLVFNSLTNLPESGKSNTTMMPFGHFLVLSKDDCQHQQYRTDILKPRFR